MWIIQEIIAETRPDLIIETGSYSGGSARLWAMIQEKVNPQGRVISIDIESTAAETKALPGAEHVEFLVGSSTAEHILNRVRREAAGKRTLVILDSDHSKPYVLRELQLYSDLVAPGSYLIVQDTNINGHPVLNNFGPGPHEAVDEFLAASSHFVRDRTRERFLFSMHQGGFLQRVN